MKKDVRQENIMKDHKDKPMSTRDKKKGLPKRIKMKSVGSRKIRQQECVVGI
jgi:hypothetical protein